MTGFVYCIGTPGGMVKIGWSADPKRRLAKIQSDTPETLSFFGVIPGGAEVEAEIHARFASLRRRGEWFEDAGGEISRAFPRYEPPTHEIADLRSWLVARRVPASDMAAHVGVSKSYLSELIAGKKRINVSLALRIEAATGGEVTAQMWSPRDLAWPEFHRVEGVLQ